MLLKGLHAADAILHFEIERSNTMPRGTAFAAFGSQDEERQMKKKRNSASKRQRRMGKRRSGVVGLVPFEVEFLCLVAAPSFCVLPSSRFFIFSVSTVPFSISGSFL
jgi:hypothetical protein